MQRLSTALIALRTGWVTVALSLKEVVAISMETQPSEHHGFLPALPLPSSPSNHYLSAQSIPAAARRHGYYL